MSSTPDPPFDSQQQGISLDALAAAFAQVMGTEPRRSDSTPPQDASSPTDAGAAAASVSESDAAKNASNDAINRTSNDAAKSGIVAGASPAQPTAQSSVQDGRGGDAVAASGDDEDAENQADDACPISPQTIFEAMLFVGNRENQPLSPGRAADLMRGVQPDEIPALVDALNQSYAEMGSPYEIVGEGNGYRLVLRQELRSLQNRFFGRVREGRLSQPAIDVLALVAYQQPVTGEQVRQLRDKPSSHILAHLVQRGLLRVERPDPKQRTPHYYTTDRFLKLFNLQSLDDLPRSEDTNQL
jgi:segregation and condensation protein B